LTINQRLLIVALVLLALEAGAVDRPELEPLPLPDLSTMEDATRRRLEELQDRVDEIASSATDRELADAYGTLGTYYLAHHLNEAAEVAFLNASRLESRDFRWAYYLGFVYQMIGKLELEREAYQSALDIRPEDIPARLHLAEVQLALGEPEEASREFRRVLEFNPMEAAAHGGLGRAASALGKPEEAVQHLSRALELQPQATILHYQLALAYRRLGDMEAARAHLAQRGDRSVGYPDPLLSALEPLKRENIAEVVLEMAADPETHDDRSFAMFAAAYLGDSPPAVEHIVEAAEELTTAAEALDPTSDQAAENRMVRARLHLALAGLHLTHDDLRATRREVELSLALAPDMVAANMMLGYVQENTGDPRGSIASYSTALALDPNNVNALRSRGNLYFDLQRDREAVADLERLCELGLEGDGARIRLAVALLRLGEFASARDNYRKALELNLEPSDEAQVRHHLGVIEARAGSVERAIEEYRTAIALDPNLEGVRLDLASALQRLGESGEAAELFRQVVEAEPRNVRALRGQAEALAALGRSSEAVDLLEKSWEAIPESVELLHALARMLASADDHEVRDGERALDLARRTLRAGATPSRLETLAMASAQAGDFVEAISVQRRVIQMVTWEDRIDALPRLEANLARYLAGQTCCAP
jgi:tetratricopeptide (TPR) repeat protein